MPRTRQLITSPMFLCLTWRHRAITTRPRHSPAPSPRSGKRRPSTTTHRQHQVLPRAHQLRGQCVKVQQEQWVPHRLSILLGDTMPTHSPLPRLTAKWRLVPDTPSTRRQTCTHPSWPHLRPNKHGRYTMQMTPQYQHQRVRPRPLDLTNHQEPKWDVRMSSLGIPTGLQSRPIPQTAVELKGLLPIRGSEGTLVHALTLTGMSI